MNNAIQKQDFLFELGCEELPPKALTKLGKALLNNVAESFDKLGLRYQQCEWFGTPRRLTVRFNQLDITQANKQVEKLGPAVAAAFDQEGKAKPAALGFAKSNGVGIEDLQRKKTDKGERLAYIANVQGKNTVDLLQEVFQKSISQLPVPKAMRWGDTDYQFSRPVHWITAILGEKVVKLELFGVTASNVTFGHRFHSPAPIELTKPSEYEQKLNKAFVTVCFQERKALIRIQIEAIAKDINAQAVVSEALLEEVAALVEWPIALLGNFEKEFLDVPSEALVSSMAEHQKYFHLLDKDGKLLPHFITVSNIESKNPQSVIDGNEKVIRPRLADAKFFYDSDRKNTLDSYIERLKKVVFQTKLGTIYDKTQRIKIIAKEIAEELEVDQSLVIRAAEICKCDLMTDMVGEFSDLQGIMGRYYANKDNEPSDVAAAMDEIYMPRFAGDKLPLTTTGTILALADRLDSLVGIFGIGQLPTGAKDPFALRRAALGALRIITENRLPLDLNFLIETALKAHSSIKSVDAFAENTQAELIKFFSARSTALYQEQGISLPVIKSVQSLNITQPTDFLDRVTAVNLFSLKAESSDLAEANKRVKNILEKSDFDPEIISVDSSIFENEEKALYDTIESMKDLVNTKVANAEYGQALEKLASLKDVVNQFFDKVMINVDDQKVRNNRLALISHLRKLFIGIADISLLQK